MTIRTFLQGGNIIQIVVDKEKCTRDGICVAECPTQVLRLEQGDPCPVAGGIDLTK